MAAVEDTDALILANMGLVHFVARRLWARGMGRDDRVAYGTIGLIRAARSYDPALGVKFSTFACKAIAWEILTAAGPFTQMIRVPQSALDTAALVAWFAGSGTTPDRRREVTAFKVAAVRRVHHLHICGESDGPCYVADQFPGNEPDPADVAARRDSQRAVSRALSRCLDRLDPRTRLVLVRRYGLDGRPESSLRDVGELVGVTMERVRQIQARAQYQLSRQLTPEILSV